MHCCVQSIPPSVQHAGTCSLLGDRRCSEQGPEAHAAGIFSLFSTSGAAFSAFRGRDEAEGNSRSSGQLRVNASDMLGAITLIFVAQCESSVKSFLLGCKNPRWAWHSAPLQTAACSSHSRASRSRRYASVSVLSERRFCHQHKQPKRPHCPSLCAFVETNYQSGK